MASFSSSAARTLADAGIGFSYGLVAALVIACLFTLFRGMEHALMAAGRVAALGTARCRWWL